MEQAVEKIANIIFSYFEANGWEYEYEKKTNRIFTGFMIDCELKKFNIVLNVFNTEVILEAFAKKFIDNDDEETWQSMETFAGWASRRLTCGKFCVFPEYRFFSFRIDILCPNAFLAEDTLELAVMRAEEAIKIYGEDFLDLGTKAHTLDEVKKDAEIKDILIKAEDKHLDDCVSRLENLRGGDPSGFMKHFDVIEVKTETSEKSSIGRKKSGKKKKPASPRSV